MTPGDLQFSVSVGKLPCVLDTQLLLCEPLGPALALRLTRVAEVWLTRALRPAEESYAGWRERVEADRAGPGGRPMLRPHERALAAWTALRERTDAASSRFRWVDDCVALSQVGDPAAADLFDRYELLATALDLRLDRPADAGDSPPWGPWCRPLDPLVCVQDSLVLSALLEGAPMLCLLERGDDGSSRPAWLLEAAARAGLQVVGPEGLPADSWLHTERRWLRRSLVAAGLAWLLDALPPLAVAHVWVEDPADDGRFAYPEEEDLLRGIRHPAALGDIWTGAQARWYRL